MGRVFVSKMLKQSTDHPDITSNILSFYYRECQEKFQREIPMDIIFVIKSFWTPGKIWSVDKQTLLSLYKMQNLCHYKISRFEAHGLIFQSNLYRDGLYLFYNLSLIAMPKYIQHIRFYVQLSRITTERRLQSTKSFISKNIKSNGTIWSSQSLKSLEFEKLESNHVQFSCFLDVLQIKYKKCARCEYKTDFFKPLSLRPFVEYKVEGIPLDKAKEIEVGNVFVSKPFGGGKGVENVNDHCWWMERVIVSDTHTFNLIGTVNERAIQCKVRLHLFRSPKNFRPDVLIKMIGTVNKRNRKFTKAQIVRKGNWVTMTPKALFDAFKSITIQIRIRNWPDYLVNHLCSDEILKDLTST